MREKLFKGSVIVAMLLLGTACGGGSSSDDSTSSLASDNGDLSDVEKKIAYYIDSAVEGVDYKCVSNSSADANGTTNNTASADNNGTEGKTDSEGAFTYESGAICTFSIDTITLKTIDTKDLKDNIVFEDDENTARFLQTLDLDGDASNGIQIDAKVVAKIASGEIALNGKMPDTDEAYTQLVTELQATVDTFKGHIVTPEEAKAHLSDTKAEIEALNGHMEGSASGEGSSTGEGSGSAEGSSSEEGKQPTSPEDIKDKQPEDIKDKQPTVPNMNPQDTESEDSNSTKDDKDENTQPSFPNPNPAGNGSGSSTNEGSTSGDSSEGQSDSSSEGEVPTPSAG